MQNNRLKSFPLFKIEFTAYLAVDRTHKQTHAFTHQGLISELVLLKALCIYIGVFCIVYSFL